MCEPRVLTVLVRCESVGASSVSDGCFESQGELAQVTQCRSGVRVKRVLSVRSQKVSRARNVSVPVTKVSRPSSNGCVQLAESSES